MSSNRWLLVFAAVLLGVLVTAVALGAVVNEAEEFDPDTPEGVVQQHLRAVEDDDAEAILGLLAPDLAERCDLTDVRNMLRGPGERSLRATLREVDVSGDRAEVVVNIDERTADLLDDGYEHEEIFDLMRVDGDWRFSSLPWPIFCRELPPAASSSEEPTPRSTPVALPRSR